MVTEDLIERWRRDTPGCEGRIHLNNAGAALMPAPVLKAIQGHLDLEAEIGGYEAADEAAGRIREVYGLLGRLIGSAPENVAIVENATVAVSQALSAFDLHPGDVLVTTRHDYTSNQLMYLSLSRRLGIEVLRAEELPEGGADPESVRRLVAHPRCRLVCLTWIPTNSGLIQAAEEVGEICEAAGVPYLVDACQALGQLPIDVARLRCDYLAATARKFLRGPRGIGFLYVSERAIARGDFPLYVDMQGAALLDEERFVLAKGAQRFENWEFPYALVLGLGEAARYALEGGIAGIEETGARAVELAAEVRETVGALPGVRVADRGARLGAIATVVVPGQDPKDLVRRLHGAGVNVYWSLHGEGPRNAPEAGATPMLRISPHYYNTREEIGRAVAALGDLLGSGA
ncbi:MAG TPA: aminotransferase class V-fold PLP-dependent enzyme [Thermoanaerobaculia bacterium]|nr:aminotransferase class V-fold PLP-dependent enzyme [Thermoanaerobaculia bacterium]